ncbi:MAG: hypothetical protein ABDK94_10290 [Atribacterota bacterium]
MVNRKDGKDYEKKGSNMDSFCGDSKHCFSSPWMPMAHAERWCNGNSPHFYRFTHGELSCGMLPLPNTYTCLRTLSNTNPHLRTLCNTDSNTVHTVLFLRWRKELF